jgi:hypothetical protein
MKFHIFSLSIILISGCSTLNMLGKAEAPPAGEDGAVMQEEQREVLGQYLHRRELTADTTAVPVQYIAVMPLENQSGFRKGIWELEKEMAALLSEKMADSPDWRVVPFEVVAALVGEQKKVKTERALEVGRLVEADIVLLGAIKDYDLSRVTVGDPMLGGYKSYSGTAELDLQALDVKNGSELGAIHTRQESVDRGLGLDLLGRPRDQDLQFMKLHQLEFGSEDFQATAIGQVTLSAMQDLVLKLEQLIKPSELDLGGEAPEVLSVFGEEVYINIGSENKLRPAYRFEVYPGADRIEKEGLDAGRRIGVVEVREIIGARLSSVRVVEGEGRIRAGDRLRLRESAGEEP